MKLTSDQLIFRPAKWLRSINFSSKLSSIILISLLTGYVVSQSFSKDPTSSETDDDLVPRQWIGAIRKYGVQAVFPPSEDVHVGDIYAILVDSDAESVPGKNKYSRRLELNPSRAIRIYRYTEILQDAQKDQESVFQFPAAAEHRAPSGSERSQFQPSSNCNGSECYQRVARPHIPIAVFPDFLNKNETRNEVSVNWISRFVNFVFSSSSSQNSNTSIEIPLVETVTVSAHSAAVHAAEYCLTTAGNQICDENYVRSQLKSLVGDAIFGNSSGDTNKTQAPPVPVRLIMIRSVFATRSIRYSTDSSVVQQVRTDAQNIIRDALNESLTEKTLNSVGPGKQDIVNTVMDRVKMSFDSKISGSAKSSLDVKLPRP
jgi:hypothetical protein